MKKNLGIKTKVTIFNTNSDIDGLTGFIAGKSSEHILDHYIVILDEPLKDYMAINIIESCIEVISASITDAQIKHMVDRFLRWKLPVTFNPDCGISFKNTFNDPTLHPMRYEPVGTNLFSAVQTEAMVRFMVEGL